MIHPPISSSLIHLQAFEPDQLLEVVQGARFEHYVLGGSRCTARVAHWSCGSFSVDVGDYDFPVRAVGAFPGNKLCLGYMRKLTEPTWVNGFRAGLDTMEIYPENTEMNYRAAPGGEWVAVEFEREAFHRASSERLGYELELPRNNVASFSVSPVGRATLDSLIQQLWRHPASGALMITSILETIAVLLNEVNTKPVKSVVRNLVKRQTMLARAERHINANITTPFDLTSLASASGATPRTLQREFLSAYGMSPQHWARCLMLHRVRKRLRSNDARKLTVEAIAHECGFRHMGRFAQYYLQLFGEHPSQTLSKQISLTRPPHE